MALWTKAGIKTLKDAIELVRSPDTPPDRHDQMVKMIVGSMTPSHWEVFEQLHFTGPVWDGSIISKSHRNDLIEVGLATRVCYKGAQGYTATTYPAYTVWLESGRKRKLAA